jgi:hypothetical protein
MQKNHSKKGGGNILKNDQKGVSFKNSLISISFSALFLDLSLRITYVKKVRSHPNKKWDLFLSALALSIV